RTPRHPPRLSLTSFPLAPLRLSPFSANRPAPAALYTLSLHDALPISADADYVFGLGIVDGRIWAGTGPVPHLLEIDPDTGRCGTDRKSTRLNSSHVSISYAVFCLKKKKKETRMNTQRVILCERLERGL